MTKPEPKRLRYRMAVRASVCFDVWATNDKDARVVAREIVQENLDGCDIAMTSDVVEDDPDARVYFVEPARPTIEDRLEE